MAPYRLRLTPDEQTRYDKMLVESDRRRHTGRASVKPIGGRPMDHEVLIAILTAGRASIGKYSQETNNSTKRLVRAGLTEYIKLGDRPSWRLTQKGQEYVEEVGLRPLEFPV